MIQDLHSHSYYSFCGGDNPEEVIKAAISGKIEMLGITDHNYGIGYSKLDIYFSPYVKEYNDYGRNLRKYYDHISLLKEKYKKDIDIKVGIEVATVSEPANPVLPDNADISYFDYCLIEHLDAEQSVLNGDIFPFVEKCGCRAGIAHTDLFAFCKKKGVEPYDFFSRLAEKEIFWEMNVNFDSIHSYRIHSYVDELLNDSEKIELIKKSGIELSVGFDGHNCAEYKPERLINACEKIEKAGIPLVFSK